MTIVHFMIPFALFLGLGFIVCFVWSVVRGQYDDLDTPAYRLLLEDEDEFRSGNK